VIYNIKSLVVILFELKNLYTIMENIIADIKTTILSNKTISLILKLLKYIIKIINVEFYNLTL
jgi:hypothetical protein